MADKGSRLLSDEAFSALRAKFLLIDVANDGKITAHNLAIFYHKVGVTPHLDEKDSSSFLHSLGFKEVIFSQFLQVHQKIFERVPADKLEELNGKMAVAFGANSLAANRSAGGDAPGLLSSVSANAIPGTRPKATRVPSLNPIVDPYHGRRDEFISLNNELDVQKASLAKVQQDGQQAESELAMLRDQLENARREHALQASKIAQNQRTLEEQQQQIASLANKKKALEEVEAKPPASTRVAGQSPTTSEKVATEQDVDARIAAKTTELEQLTKQASEQRRKVEDAKRQLKEVTDMLEIKQYQLERTTTRLAEKDSELKKREDKLKTSTSIFGDPLTSSSSRPKLKSREASRNDDSLSSSSTMVNTLATIPARDVLSGITPPKKSRGAAALGFSESVAISSSQSHIPPVSSHEVVHDMASSSSSSMDSHVTRDTDAMSKPGGYENTQFSESMPSISSTASGPAPAPGDRPLVRTESESEAVKTSMPPHLQGTPIDNLSTSEDPDELNRPSASPTDIRANWKKEQRNNKIPSKRKLTERSQDRVNPRPSDAETDRIEREARETKDREANKVVKDAAEKETKEAKEREAREAKEAKERESRDMPKEKDRDRERDTPRERDKPNRDDASESKEKDRPDRSDRSDRDKDKEKSKESRKDKERSKDKVARKRKERRKQRKSAAPGDLNAISETDPDADQSSSATTSSATSSSSRHLLPKADPIDPSLISTLTNKIQMLSLPLQNYLPHLDLLYVSIITDEQRVSQSLAAIMSELSASKEEKEVIHKLVTETIVPLVDQCLRLFTDNSIPTSYQARSQLYSYFCDIHYAMKQILDILSQRVQLVAESGDLTEAKMPDAFARDCLKMYFAHHRVLMRWSQFREAFQNVFTEAQFRSFAYLLDPFNVGSVQLKRLTQLVQSFGPMKQCLQWLKIFLDHPAFQGFLTDNEIISILTALPYGTYLISLNKTRPKISFQLSWYSTDDKVHTARLVLTQPNQQFEIELGPASIGTHKIDTSKGKSFASLSELFQACGSFLTTPFVSKFAARQWFHGDINSDEATRLLLPCGDGAFLFRLSSKKGHLAISYVFRDKVGHTLIKFSNNDEYENAGFTYDKGLGQIVQNHSQIFKFVVDSRTWRRCASHEEEALF